MLTRRTIEQHAWGRESNTQEAMLAFLAARYIEWLGAITLRNLPSHRRYSECCDAPAVCELGQEQTNGTAAKF
jgi:hypothetical protein